MNLVGSIRRTAMKLYLRNMFWEYSPSSVNIASYWLRAKSSTVDEVERKILMDDDVDTSLASDGMDLFVDLWEAQPCLTEPK